MRVYLYIWVVARQELCTRSIREHNSLTGHDNIRDLKFDLFFFFFEFQKVISDKPPLPPSPQRHYDVLRTKIDM